MFGTTISVRVLPAVALVIGCGAARAPALDGDVRTKQAVSLPAGADAGAGAGHASAHRQAPDAASVQTHDRQMQPDARVEQSPSALPPKSAMSSPPATAAMDSQPAMHEVSSRPGTDSPVAAAAPLRAADPSFVAGVFTGSQRCAQCHDGIVDHAGADVSIRRAWSATMMANAARDPLWQAKLESELTRNPQVSEVIAERCTRCHAPMANELARRDAASLPISAHGVDSSSPYFDAAQDGVSCTLCHQVQPTGLGTLSGFSGGYQISEDRTIFGPYQDVFAPPMQNMLGYTPQYGEHVTRSELCGSCHNALTPIIDGQGEVVSTGLEDEFPEQMPYTEWQHSAFAADTSCADCHMGRTDGVIISARPPWLSTQRDRFALHGFAGANQLMLGILDTQRDALGVSAADFAPIMAKTEAMLRGAASLEVEQAALEAGVMRLAVRVRSQTGHKLPTSFPSRRMILHVRVDDERGETLFESGRVDPSGRVANLASEDDPAALEPHHDLIESPDAAQIYESVMRDTSGALTFTLLRGAGYLKDNRILPRGADKATLPSEIAVAGRARDDADFLAGSDVVHYRVTSLPLSATRIHVTVELLYQTLGYPFAQDLFREQGPAARTFQAALEQAEHKTNTLAKLELDVP